MHTDSQHTQRELPSNPKLFSKFLDRKVLPAKVEAFQTKRKMILENWHTVLIHYLDTFTSYQQSFRVSRNFTQSITNSIERKIFWEFESGSASQDVQNFLHTMNAHCMKL